MIKNSKIKYVLISVASVIITLLLVVGISYCVKSSSASSNHTYHANMISKNFRAPVYAKYPTYYVETKSDNFVNHVRNLGDYKVETRTTGRASGREEQVILVRRYDTPYQKKMLNYQKQILKCEQKRTH